MCIAVCIGCVCTYCYCTQENDAKVSICLLGVASGLFEEAQRETECKELLTLSQQIAEVCVSTWTPELSSLCKLMTPPSCISICSLALCDSLAYK